MRTNGTQTPTVTALIESLCVNHPDWHDEHVAMEVERLMRVELNAPHADATGLLVAQNID